ncbi:hypothetical protein; putative membrane protein [Bradyrhizobium sp. ORS 278]|uniref:hypothetical protein n=1 Tax=Bradyrhizobium sp. (strain ORS 278) TaxID=114615 RepID=UPI00015083DA|nr:hypothetical protein [Bradyrhizobium sp. ORS 278]CAL80002.1 hypothetical protein; putative membrane protein [Bradyrhizobium sp. ORS 278]
MTLHLAEEHAGLRTLRAVAYPQMSCWILVIVVFGTGIILRHLTAGNSDVSWLLIAGERWLDGQRLYSEILETNPPMAVLVYVPALLIARQLGLSPEIVLDSLVFFAIAASLAASLLILRPSIELSRYQAWGLAIAAIMALALLPLQSFGQREHIAVIELMPFIALLAVRLHRELPPRWATWVAGAGLGLALCFKPHFALVAAGGVGFVAAYLRSPRTLLSPENLVAAAVVSIYGVCTVLLFPEYITDMLPLVRDVYSIGLPLSLMLMKPAPALWGLILTLTLVRKRGRELDPVLLLLITTSVAFFVVYLLQRKGWPYHSYPMLAFAWLSLGFAMSSPAAASLVSPLGFARGILAMALVVPTVSWFNHALDASFLQPAIARIGIEHPTVLAISGNGGLAHPLTRRVGGIWASRQQSLLVASYEDYARESGMFSSQSLTIVDDYAQRERRWMIEDFRRVRPDIVLVDNMTGPWRKWLHESPELDALLMDYRLTETIRDVEVYVRQVKIDPHE